MTKQEKDPEKDKKSTKNQKPAKKNISSRAKGSLKTAAKPKNNRIDSWPDFPKKPLKVDDRVPSPTKMAEMAIEANSQELPQNMVLPLVSIVNLNVLPGVSMTFDIIRDSQKMALKESQKTNSYIFLAAIKHENKGKQDPNDIFEVGTIVKLRQIAELPSGMGFKVMVEGIARAKLVRFVEKEPFTTVEVTKLIPDAIPDANLAEAYKRMIIGSLENYAAISGKIQPDIFSTIEEIESLSLLSDTIISNLNMKFDKKTTFLEAVDTIERAGLLNEYLNEESKILFYERSLIEKVRDGLDQSQKEYFLREQMRVIKDELAESNQFTEETSKCAEMLAKIKVDDETREKFIKEIKRLEITPSNSPEISQIRNYLDLVFELPWGVNTLDNLSLDKARKILDKDHYGMEKVKERIIEFLAVRKLKSQSDILSIKGPILCFVGPPGVGKTSIAKSLAQAIGRKYVRMSLGGLHDESEIRGHRRTYIGSMPGRFINAMKQAKSSNPLILLDEVDKIGKDFRGDPAAALLEVLDPEQNNSFRDNYLEVPFDLSKVMFITTANTRDTIPSALLDRMEVVELTGYTEEEKTEIAIRHIVPKQIIENGLNKSNISFTKAGIKEIIRNYTGEAGVRGLEKKIAKICRKAAIQISDNASEKIIITPETAEKMLGHKFQEDSENLKPQIGIAKGLAWSQVGGSLLSIEVILMEGSGKMELTGQLGDVMKESARLSHSYVRSNAKSFGIDPAIFQKKDIHIHVPAGATPKEGPSAGAALTIALISAYTERPVIQKTAMTGEMTLRGNVMAVGGIKEKLIAADRFGMSKVLIPYSNRFDIEELPESVKKRLEIVPVKTIEDVIFHTMA